MIADNSPAERGGPRGLGAGVSAIHVMGRGVVTPAGGLVGCGGRTGDTPGYDLRGLFVGAEGTLGITTKITLRLLRRPEATRTLLAIFDSVDQASEAVSAIIGGGIVPSALEMIDQLVISAVVQAMDVGYPADAGAVLLIEVDGLREAVAEESLEIRDVCLAEGAREVREADEAAEREKLWAGRKGSISALGRLAPNYYVLDGVVPRTKLPAVLREVYRLGEEYGFPIANVFHAGDGNLHPNVLFDERKPGESERVLEVGAAIMRLCVDAGGTITGEHGVGLEKRGYMDWIFSEDDIAAMAKVKAAFGSTDLYNPCKIFPTGKGCGEVSQAKIEHVMKQVGPDAYI